MACGPNCACDPGIECLSVVDPVRFGYFADWCNSGDEAKRRHVRNRSAMGIRPEPAPEVSEVQALAPATPPGLMTRAATFARAVVTHAVAGLPTVDEATAQARLCICRACPEFNTTDPDKPTCNQCGCRMDIKIYWSEQVCPIGKW